MQQLPYIAYDISENIVHDQLGFRKVIRSNEKYLFHKYDIHTCGDKEQIYLSVSNGIDVENDHNKFDRIVDYIHDKFKRGIFVSIRNGKMNKFVPFVNENYMNDFGALIDTSAKKSIRSVRGLNIMDEHFWYADNSVIYLYRNSLDNMRTWNDNDKNFFDMITNLLEKEDVLDCDFFLNTWCYPIVKKDGTDPWIYGRRFADNLLDIDVPILSISNNIEYRDKLIPSYRDYDKTVDSVLPFHERLPRIIYKGTTICSSEAKTNYYRMCEIHDAFDYHATTDNDGMYVSDNKLKIRNTCKQLGYQKDYKYVMMIHSHAACFEFSKVLRSGYIPFYVKGDVDSYIEQHLIEWVHYIPVTPDMTDLMERFLWIESNPKAADSMLIALSELSYLIDEDYMNGELKKVLDNCGTMTTSIKPFVAKQIVSSLNVLPKTYDYITIYYDQLWKQDHALYVSKLLNTHMVKIQEGVSIKYLNPSAITFQKYMISSKVVMQEVIQILISLSTYLHEMYTKYGCGWRHIQMQDVCLVGNQVYIDNYTNCYVLDLSNQLISGPALYTSYQTSGLVSLITELCHYIISKDNISATDCLAINKTFKEVYEPYYSCNRNYIQKGLTQKRKFLRELMKGYSVLNFISYQHSKKRLQTNAGYAEKLYSLHRHYYELTV